jgi:hypothetical protein
MASDRLPPLMLPSSGAARTGGFYAPSDRAHREAGFDFRVLPPPQAPPGTQPLYARGEALWNEVSQNEWYAESQGRLSNGQPLWYEDWWLLFLTYGKEVSSQLGWVTPYWVALLPKYWMQEGATLFLTRPMVQQDVSAIVRQAAQAAQAAQRNTSRELEEMRERMDRQRRERAQQQEESRKRADLFRQGDRAQLEQQRRQEMEAARIAAIEREKKRQAELRERIERERFEREGESNPDIVEGKFFLPGEVDAFAWHQGYSVTGVKSAIVKPYALWYSTDTDGPFGEAPSLKKEMEAALLRFLTRNQSPELAKFGPYLKSWGLTVEPASSRHYNDYRVTAVPYRITKLHPQLAAWLVKYAKDNEDDFARTWFGFVANPAMPNPDTERPSIVRNSGTGVGDRYASYLSGRSQYWSAGRMSFHDWVETWPLVPRVVGRFWVPGDSHIYGGSEHAFVTSNLPQMVYRFMEKNDNWKQFGEEPPAWWRSHLRVDLQSVQAESDGTANHMPATMTCAVYTLEGASAAQRDKFLGLMQQGKAQGRLAEMVGKMFNAPGPVMVEAADEAKLVQGVEREDLRYTFQRNNNGPQPTLFAGFDGSFHKWYDAWVPFMTDANTPVAYGSVNASVLRLRGVFWIPGVLERDYSPAGLEYTMSEGYKNYISALLHADWVQEGARDDVDWFSTLADVDVKTRAEAKAGGFPAIRIQFRVDRLNYKQMATLRDALLAFSSPAEAFRALFGLPATPIVNAQDAMLVGPEYRHLPDASLTVDDAAYNAAAAAWQAVAEQVKNNLPPPPPQDFRFGGRTPAPRFEEDDSMPQFRDCRAEDDDCVPRFTSLGGGDEAPPRFNSLGADDEAEPMDTSGGGGGGRGFRFSGR